MDIYDVLKQLHRDEWYGIERVPGGWRSEDGLSLPANSYFLLSGAERLYSGSFYDVINMYQKVKEKENAVSIVGNSVDFHHAVGMH